MKLYKLIAPIIALNIFLFSCFSDFTINEDSQEYIDLNPELTYELTLTASNGTKKVIEYKPGDVIELERGLWKIEIRELRKADDYNEEIESLGYGSDHFFEDGIIKVLIGETTQEIWGGTVTATKIPRTNQLIEVTNWAQLLAAVNILNEGYATTIFLKGEVYDADRVCEIYDNKKITLIPDGNIKIKRNKNIIIGGTFDGLPGIFEITNGKLFLGEKGMSGTLTIDGNKEEYTEQSPIVKVSYGSFEMHENVTLKKNATSAVFVRGTFDMWGGTISGSTASGTEQIYYGKGGGVYVGGGSFNMHGGEISDNTAVNGGGVYVSGTFNMYDGAIIDNHVKSLLDNNTGNGGGVFLASVSSDYTALKFTMEGGIISGNTATKADDDDDNENKAGNGGGVFISFPATSSDLTGSFIMIDGTISGNTAEYGGGVYVDANTGKTDDSFTMEGGTISGNTAVDDGGGVYITGGKVTIKNNASITSNTATENGGGIYNNGYLIMEGGTIGGNGFDDEGIITKNGGGVYVAEKAEFVMEGGTIGETLEEDKNTATNNGGGVYVDLKANFTMIDGTISNNTANSGGGVYVHSTNMTDGGIFTMNNGTISNNKSNNGGGVYINNYATFTMNNGTISGNNATVNGGGVYSNGNFKMFDGTIGGTSEDDKNEATNGGGFFGNTAGSFQMTGGTISKNKAANIGGGVDYIIGVASIHPSFITGGKITDNKALLFGGIAEPSNDSFFINDNKPAIVYGNTPKEDYED